MSSFEELLASAKDDPAFMEWVKEAAGVKSERMTVVRHEAWLASRANMTVEDLYEQLEKLGHKHYQL